LTKNFYDAVLLGLGLPTLIAGGLLAKRGFRVLVVAQGQPLPSYEIGGITVPRAPFTLTGAESPAVTRVFSELALKPLLRRRIQPLYPAFQAMLPRHRIDFSPDLERVAREIEREFPAVRRTADDFMRASGRAWENIDRLVARDLMWPPSSFLERRAFTRASSNHPFGREDQATSPLSDLPDDHPLRRIVDAVLAFADGSRLGEGNPQRLLRLFGAALRGASLEEGGYAGLVELLMHSIRTHNGELRFADRVERISVRRGSIESVRLSPSDEEIGCHFVLNGLPVSKLGRLLSDRSNLDAMLDDLGAPRPRFLRYTLNVVTHADAIPEGLGRNVLVLPEAHEAEASGPTLHVQIERRAGDLAVLTSEALLPVLSQEAQVEQLATQRERMLTALERVSPFLAPHVRFIDSPHDGRGIFDASLGRETPSPDAWSRGPETMPTVYAFARTRLHGTCALPVRTDIKRLLLCSDQVIPGLGLEGTFITAWSAARAVTRSLKRDWMNRGRWTKVDL